MAALICPTTGVVVDASGKSYDKLVKAGYKPVEQAEQPKEQPKRRTRKASTAE